MTLWDSNSRPLVHMPIVVKVGIHGVSYYTQVIFIVSQIHRADAFDIEAEINDEHYVVCCFKLFPCHNFL